MFLLTTIALMVQGYSNIRLFQAQARVLIEDERSTAMPGISESAYYEDPLPYYQTQYRILKGRDLTRRVVKRLELATVPEFNGTATPPSTPTVIIRGAISRVAGLLRPSRPVIEDEAPKADETADESALVSAFLSRVEVLPVPDSRLVDITFTSTSPQLAADAVNALVDEYVSQNLEVKLQSTQNMLDWLEKEVQTQQQKVEASERDLSNYRDRENAMSLDDKNNIVVLAAERVERRRAPRAHDAHREGSAVRSGQGDGAGRDGGFDPGRGAESPDPGRQGAARGPSARESPALGEVRGKAPRDPARERPGRRRPAAAGAGDGQGAAVGPERVRAGASSRSARWRRGSRTRRGMRRT